METICDYYKRYWGSELKKEEFEIEKLPKLRYTFNLEVDDRCEGKSLDELKESLPKPNWTIVDKMTGEEFIPEVRGEGYYARD